MGELEETSQWSNERGGNEASGEDHHDDHQEQNENVLGQQHLLDLLDARIGQELLNGTLVGGGRQYGREGNRGGREEEERGENFNEDRVVVVFWRSRRCRKIDCTSCLKRVGQLGIDRRLLAGRGDRLQFVSHRWAGNQFR